MNGAAFLRTLVGTIFSLASMCGRETTVPTTPLAPPSSLDPTPPDPPAGSFSSACPAPAAPKNPLEFGLCVFEQAKSRAKSDARVSVLLASDPAAQGIAVEGPPESYSIVSRDGQTWVVGRDATGAMYGALDLAERLDQHGAASAVPIAAPVKTSPLLPIRGANLFLIMPEEGQPSWWFRDLAFWTEYLDMMARARLDFLDLHGMYDLRNTLFANPLFYFATSASFPNVGLPKAEREKNLAMLNRIITMAAVRGIKVGLMSYRATLTAEDTQKEETLEETTVAPEYTREAVADLATRAPGLDYLGFRVGESKRPTEWYASTYLAGLKQAYSHTTAYTRSWLTTKKALLGILREAGPDAIVEVKYNGEQLGPPYVISGGQMETWKTYSYEDLLEPPTPYRFVFQVRAGGTHRIFRYASYARTRRTIRSMTMSPRVSGFTLEAAHAYFPQRDFYHADPADSFSPYAFRRDELSYLLFGRLGYDPNTPESTFRSMLAARVGTEGLWDAVQAASDITPLMLAAHTCGPDQRDYAPELELGGPVSYWATPRNSRKKDFVCLKTHGTFDEFAIAAPDEAAADLLERRGTSRLSPTDVALMLFADAKNASSATMVSIDQANAEARDVVRECAALSSLGEWFAHKLRSATALAVYEGSSDGRWFDTAKIEASDAARAYSSLAATTAYIAPFEELMRMKRLGLTRFHWKEQLPHLAEDSASLEEAQEEVRAHPRPSHAKGALPDPKTWLETPRRDGPGLASFVVTPDDASAPSWTVTATFAVPVPPGTVVQILHRPFRSNGPDWAPIQATGQGKTWSATVPGTGHGGMFAVDVNAGPGNAWRYPDVTRETPYKAVAP